MQQVGGGDECAPELPALLGGERVRRRGAAVAPARGAGEQVAQQLVGVVGPLLERLLPPLPLLLALRELPRLPRRHLLLQLLALLLRLS